MVSTKTTTRRRAIGKRVRRTTTRRRAIGKRLVVGKKKGSCRRYNRQQSLRQSGRYRQVVKKTIGGTNITIDKIDIITTNQRLSETTYEINIQYKSDNISKSVTVHKSFLEISKELWKPLKFDSFFTNQAFSKALFAFPKFSENRYTIHNIVTYLNKFFKHYKVLYNTRMLDPTQIKTVNTFFNFSNGVTVDSAVHVKEVGPQHMQYPIYEIGENIEYYSTSIQEWIPAYVTGVNRQHGTYNLNVKSNVTPDRMRPPRVPQQRQHRQPENVAGSAEKVVHNNRYPPVTLPQTSFKLTILPYRYVEVTMNIEQTIWNSFRDHLRQTFTQDNIGLQQVKYRLFKFEHCINDIIETIEQQTNLESSDILTCSTIKNPSEPNAVPLEIVVDPSIIPSKV